ncbi:MAG: hypothetical protein R3256_12535 [Thalassovita sp.]|nr:hypothetical protein [Thalassovita sp.]
MHRILVLFALLLLPDPARAGAWLREQGGGFLSVSTYLLEAGSGGQNYAGIYLEYGLKPRLTLGLDLGRGVSGHTKSIAFLRLPLGSADGPHRFALDAGFGEIAGHPTFRPGFSYGYGFDSGLGQGWLSLETMVEMDLRDRDTDYKVDLTIGLAPNHKLKLLLQLQSGRAAGDPFFLRVVPSLTRRIGKGWQAEFGFTRELIGGRASGLKLGLWKRF